MAIPSIESNYPAALDTDANLFLVHDSLRVKLAVDYQPGDTSITIYDENNVMSLFPPTGIITLTEQCSDIDERAISLYYNSKTDTSFDELELLPGFPSVAKPKNFTNVTLNVIDRHHNVLKNAIIAIQEFVGIQGTTDTRPFGETIEGRTNFLMKLVFTPRAWFSANQTMGLVPLTVVFTDESFQLGSGTITYTWNFGDCSPSVISVISCSDISVTTSRTISHTYLTPSYYDVTLTVSNAYGVDTIVMPSFINARVAAPDEAVAQFVPIPGEQKVTPGVPPFGPYVTPPTIRSPMNAIISVQIPGGVNPATGRTWGGVQLVDGHPIDPIEEYTWSLGDDLTHANQDNAKALYSMGGIFDLVLRVDTKYGAYRITKYSNCIDVVEDRNIWLWAFNTGGDSEGGYAPLDYLARDGLVKAYEFGLLSETFKTGGQTFNIWRDQSFLNGSNNEFQAKTEFRRNVGFTPRTTTSSGSFGSCLIYWASQGCVTPPPGTYATDHEIKITEFNGFDDTYTTHTPICQSWNWINLNSTTKSYFVFGVDYNAGSVPSHNYSLQRKTTYDLLTLTATFTTLDINSYTNGAQELQEFVSNYSAGVPTNGYFAVYRSAWKDSAGYFLRNDGVGEFFRLKSFYKTEGTIGQEFQTITKLTDITGPIKVEGQLVSLSDGLFFFDNSGNISAYNTTSNTWETGGAIAASASFRSLQDTSIKGFDSSSNTLLATSDNDRSAYLSYDYSPYAFIKFSSLELTFSNIGPRPGWEHIKKSQFLMGMY